MPVHKLDLINNTLSGLLPPSWGSAASNLSSLSLSDNHLTGGALHLKLTRETASANQLKTMTLYLACFALAQVLFPRSMLHSLASEFWASTPII